MVSVLVNYNNPDLRKKNVSDDGYTVLTVKKSNVHRSW